VGQHAITIHTINHEHCNKISVNTVYTSREAGNGDAGAEPLCGLLVGNRHLVVPG
jgi:hypothetical protein